MLRAFKLLRFMDEAQMLGGALQASARRIGVFLLFVVMAQVVFGIITIPTGVVTVESIHQARQDQLRICSLCGHEEHRS